MKKIIKTIAVIAMMIGCAGVQAQHAPFVAQAKRVLTDNFRDPGAAKYRDLAVYRQLDGKTIALCGEVNAKNAYGAYTGFSSFYADLKFGYVRADGEDKRFDAMRMSYCDKRVATAK